MARDSRFFIKILPPNQYRISLIQHFLPSLCSLQYSAPILCVRLIKIIHVTVLQTSFSKVNMKGSNININIHNILCFFVFSVSPIFFFTYMNMFHKYWFHQDWHKTNFYVKQWDNSYKFFLTFLTDEANNIVKSISQYFSVSIYSNDHSPAWKDPEKK